MKRLLLIVTTVCALTSIGHADIGSGFIGGEFGVLLQNGTRPSIAYAGTQDFSLTKVPIVGSILGKFGCAEGWEASVLYGRRTTTLTTETYAARLFNYKVFSYGGFFAGVGFGSWTMVNSDGQDVTYTAGKTGFGYAKGPVVFRIAADVVGVRGDNLHFIHFGIMILP